MQNVATYQLPDGRSEGIGTIRDLVAIFADATITGCTRFHGIASYHITTYYGHEREIIVADTSKADAAIERAWQRQIKRQQRKAEERQEYIAHVAAHGWTSKH